MFLHDFLSINAARWPDKEACLCAGRRLNYGAFEADANRFAHALLEAGRNNDDAARRELRKNLALMDDPASLAALIALCMTDDRGRQARHWADRFQKMSFPIRYGRFCQVKTPAFLFEFNLNAEI